MSDDSFSIRNHNIGAASLEILIQIYSKQEALIHLVMDELIDKGKDENALAASFDDDYRAEKKRIMNLLFEDYGELDLKDIFPEDDKE